MADNTIELFSTFDAAKIKQQLKSQTQSIIETRFLNAAEKLQKASPVGVSKRLGESDLASGWNLDVIGFSSDEFVVELNNRAPFALNRLEGRKSGKRPPIDALLPWVQFKLNIGSYGKARQIAFLIARKIGKAGTIRSQRNFKEFDPVTGQFAPNSAVAIAIKQIERDLQNIIIG